jgi:aldehyde dehydrogenase (NAD+)
MASPTPELETRLFINNEFVEAKSGKTVKVTNPATGEHVGNAHAAGPEDVDAAVAAASAAFKGPWSTFTGAQRRECLEKLADLISERLEAVARIDAISMGMPVTLGQHVLGPLYSQFLKSFAGFCEHLPGDSFPEGLDGMYKV